MRMNDMTFLLRSYLDEKQALVNLYLKRILSPYQQQRPLIKAMDYSLMAGGKRLRPILVLAAANACGRNESIALPVSCALEMIHTYSLIHDDLPAMDDDDLRRGKPACHVKFGEAIAILAGDALLTHAFNILAHPEPYFKEHPNARIKLDLISLVSDAAGIQGMVEGQVLDIQSYKNDTDNKVLHLKKIHAVKTGRMITASVLSGAVSVGAESHILAKLEGYAENIGLAFQVVDDILNIEGDPKIMGKGVGSDARHDKMTFPAIIGLDESKNYAKELVDNALAAIEKLDARAAPLRAIAEYIINRDH